MSDNPLSAALANLPEIAQRLVNGDQFNAYQYREDRGVWVVGLGPVTRFLGIAYDLDENKANLIVDALRYAAGQDLLVADEVQS